MADYILHLITWKNVIDLHILQVWLDAKIDLSLKKYIIYTNNMSS